jgi:phosphohistidine phosphatase
MNSSVERRTLLLIGHQAGVRELVLSPAGDVDGDAPARARTKFPTSAIAALASRTAWGRLVPGSAALTDSAVPRGQVGGIVRAPMRSVPGTRE